MLGCRVPMSVLVAGCRYMIGTPHSRYAIAIRNRKRNSQMYKQMCHLNNVPSHSRLRESKHWLYSSTWLLRYAVITSKLIQTVSLSAVSRSFLTRLFFSGG